LILDDSGGWLIAEKMGALLLILVVGMVGGLLPIYV